jgi:tRNA-uridine 2-sulfurtransferase
VFYDAPSGQARVLGGGFIQSASAKSASEKGATKGAGKEAAARPLVEAMRG